MLKTKIGILLSTMFLAVPAFADQPPGPSEALELRALDLRVRPNGDFKVPLPGTADPALHYQLEWGEALFKAPLIADVPLAPESSLFVRTFFDKILLKDGSALDFGGEKIPLTCAYVEGEDNRGSGQTGPLFPQLLLRVYLVANDFSCTGPINPGWPGNGLRRDAWDTYLYYEVRDPTIMMPTEVKIRYRWNEFSAVWTGK